MEILIADDDETIRRILETLLNKYDYKVLAADDGVEAWNIITKNRIRMAIIDLKMPRLDGFSLCKKIRSANFPYYIYLIILTGAAINECKNGYEAGADDFMVKPFDSDILMSKLRAGRRIIELEDKHKDAYIYMLQSEKMASIGQLAAGIAHEINNPTGFVSSNLKTLKEYFSELLELITYYKDLSYSLKSDELCTIIRPALNFKLEMICKHEKSIDLDFVLKDIQDLICESLEGAARIKKIVTDLKNFSHPGEDTLQPADINENLNSTLNVVWNELKYKAVISKEFGELPPVYCYPQQLNQVFMNILVNAGQAIQNKGEIKIVTISYEDEVEIRISDTGQGIPRENLIKIFDPFFTTKEVGKGTGLGLNISYNIIKKHKGSINVESEQGKGTTFIIRIPVNLAYESSLTKV